MKAFNLGWQLEQHPLHTDLNGNYSDPSGKGKPLWKNAEFSRCFDLFCTSFYVFYGISCESAS